MFSPAPSTLAPFSPLQTRPCPAFPVAVLFPDVGPDVLAREEANETRRAGWPEPMGWHAYLHRVMPALERSVAGEMAQAMLAAGIGVVGSRSHAERMRRRAIAAGAVHKAHFWADVTEEIGRVARS